jgi:hypothetical protein
MKRRPAQPEKIEVETDPRFPSGRWTGFWLQRHFLGRQWMSLNLMFCDGIVRGEGTDRVGDFTMAGTYDLKTGGCRLVKAYVGAHSLDYQGRNEGDGQWIWGVWQMRMFDRGGFHLWPAGEDDPTGKTLKEEKELPREDAKVKWETVEEPV